MKKTPELQSIGLTDFLDGKVVQEKAPAKTRRLLNGLLYAGDWVFIHGNKADANALVATAFAVLLAGGYDLNGKISTNKARPVLYLDSSNDADASRQRMRALIPPDDNWSSTALYENLQISAPHIDPSAYGFNLNAPEDQQALETMLLSMGSQPCLVLDRLAHWLGDGSRRSFASWLMTLKAQGVTVFLVSCGSKSRSAFALLEHAAQLFVEVGASEHQTGEADFKQQRAYHACQLRTEFSVFGSNRANIYPHSSPQKNRILDQGHRRHVCPSQGRQNDRSSFGRRA
jgi:hypothetical protein